MSMADKVQGLCGVMDEPQADHVLPDGTVTKDATEFGNSWVSQLPQEEG